MAVTVLRPKRQWDGGDGYGAGNYGGGYGKLLTLIFLLLNLRFNWFSIFKGGDYGGNYGGDGGWGGGEFGKFTILFFNVIK